MPTFLQVSWAGTGWSSSDDRHSRETISFSECHCHLHFKRLCRGAEKDTVFLYRKHHDPQTNTGRMPPCCGIRDQLFQIPSTCDFPLSSFDWQVFVQTYRISRGGLYQHVRCSIMWQIIPFHRGSVIIICGHVHVLSERFFLVLIIDRMSERMLQFISTYTPHKSIILWCAVTGRGCAVVSVVLEIQRVCC